MSLNKKTLRDITPAGKRIFVRVDFNVPLEEGTTGSLKVADDTRIRAALPTLTHLLREGAAVIAASHLGRPKGEVKDELRMKPVAEHLAQLLNQEMGHEVVVRAATDTIGQDAQSKAQELKPGELLLLENLRFDAGEKAGDAAFAAALASFADIYVNDAFGTCHRAHASMAGVPALVKPALAGKLLEKELRAFDSVLGNGKRPIVAIMGGAKVSDKLVILENLLQKVDCVLIGGGMAYTFMAASGCSTGDSLVEEERFDVAHNILAKAKELGVRVILPVDHVVANAFAEDAETQLAHGSIEQGWMGLDIGPKTRELYAYEIAHAGTVVWNGPMGVFEMEPFAQGTLAIASALADSDCTSVIGGGDSVAAINKMGLAGSVSHISTGGGSFLEMLEGKTLPGFAALDDA